MTNPDVPSKHCQEGPYIYDDGAFTIWKSRFGLWNSADSTGKSLVTSADKESVVIWSREHLNGFQNSTTITTKVKADEGYKL